MSDHSKFAELASRLIAKSGRLITLQKLSAGANASMPWRGAEAQVPTEPVTLFGAFLPASGSGLGTIVTNKDLLARVEQVALVAPTQDGTALEEMTLMQDGGNTYRIDWVQVLKPGDQTCLYVFGVCK